nr:radical SAM family heme chaperone HemW [Candidatus Gracilibacteria bacterium]
MFCYIHIPFCESRCKYCRFSTFVENDNLKKQFYVDFLVKSIENNNLGFKIQESNLKSIYFGGGTPTSLSNIQLLSIIQTLKEKFNFSHNIEITLETTPNNITSKNLEEWDKMGINRLSLGIQTLNNNALNEIGRIDKNEIFEKLNLLRLSKIKNISVDFIIGLPYVNKGETFKDISYILDNYSFVKHISLYMLEDYYDYPESWQKLSIKEEDFLGEYVMCKNYLEEKGFYRYELSNFAKKDFQCKHNKAYWNHSELIAFGLSAHGFLNNTRYTYPNTFSKYYTGLIEFDEKLSKKDIFLEKVMFGLRTNGLEKDIYEKLNMLKINEFINGKMLEIKNNKLIIKDIGVVILDYIIKEIL